MKRKQDRGVRCRLIPGGSVREFPAGQLRFRVAAYGIALRQEAVLLTRSAITGRWELPGGAVEPWETLPEGLAREFAEETGITPAVGEPVGFDEDFVAFFGRHAFHGLRFFFRVALPPEATLTPQAGEVREMAWWPLASLPGGQMAEGHEAFIRRAARESGVPGGDGQAGQPAGAGQGEEM